MAVSAGRVRATTIAGWVLFSAAGLVVAFLLAFVVATLPGRFGSGTESAWTALRLDLGLWLALFGLLGMLVVWISPRPWFGTPAVAWRDALLPWLGIAFAVSVELSLHEWAEASLGYYDWDLIGPTAALSFLLVLVAIGVFANRIAPPAAGRWPAVGVVLCAALVVVIVASNVPALADGIRRHSWPVAIAIGLAGVYGVVAIASLRWRSRC